MKKTTDASLFFLGGQSWASFLGPHGEGEYVAFRFLGPDADAVFLAGELNGWGESLPMTRISEDGVFEILVDKSIAREGMLYKYLVQRGEEKSFCADPYARRAERTGNHASVLFLDEDAAPKSRALSEHAQRVAEDAPLVLLSRPIPSPETLPAMLSAVKQRGGTALLFPSFWERDAEGEANVPFALPERVRGTAQARFLADSLHEAGLLYFLDWLTPDAVLASGICSGERELVTSPSVKRYLFSHLHFWMTELFVDGFCIDKGTWGSIEGADALLDEICSELLDEIPRGMILVRDKDGTETLLRSGDRSSRIATVGGSADKTLRPHLAEQMLSSGGVRWPDESQGTPEETMLAEISLLYLSHKALWAPRKSECEGDRDGVLHFRREDEAGEVLHVLLNFTSEQVSLDRFGFWKDMPKTLLFHSEIFPFVGEGIRSAGRNCSDLDAFSIMVLEEN